MWRIPEQQADFAALEPARPDAAVLRWGARASPTKQVRILGGVQSGPR